MCTYIMHIKISNLKPPFCSHPHSDVESTFYTYPFCTTQDGRTGISATKAAMNYDQLLLFQHLFGVPIPVLSLVPFGKRSQKTMSFSWVNQIFHYFYGPFSKSQTVSLPKGIFQKTHMKPPLFASIPPWNDCPIP